MSRADDPALAASAPAALAARARSSPHHPWLFHRDGLEWRWRSWSRAADQVTRGAAVLRRTLAGPGRRVAFDARQDPDAVAVGLAIQAAGAVALPVRGPESPEGAAWAQVEGATPPPIEALQIIALPAALSPLERTPPQPLELAAGAPPGGLELPGAGELAAAAVMSAARSLAGRLPAADGRPILCAAPDLGLLTAHLLAAWTLSSDAAWVLEPLAEAFVATVLWARPTLVCASACELAELAESLRQRKHRRHHRLAAVVLLGAEELPAPAREIVRDLGVPIVPLPPEAVQSLVGDGSSPATPHT